MIQDRLTDKLEELERKRFTGNVTLHYLKGTPRKIRLEEVQDLGARPPTLRRV